MATKIGAFNKRGYRIAIAAAGGAQRSPVNPSNSLAFPFQAITSVLFRLCFQDRAAALSLDVLFSYTCVRLADASATDMNMLTTTPVESSNCNLISLGRLFSGACFISSN
jgi:hypothetical protein